MYEVKSDLTSDIFSGSQMICYQTKQAHKLSKRKKIGARLKLDESKTILNAVKT